MFELIERMRLPTVLFAEGGGGRPGDTDYPVVSALDTRAFALWARISGLAPRIAIVAGRCFAGNAVLAGSADLIVATEEHRARDGRPGDGRRGRARRVRARARSGRSTSSPRTGSSTSGSPTRPRRSRSTKRLLAYFQGPLGRVGGARPAAAPRGRSRRAAGAPTTSTRRSTRSSTSARRPTCATSSRKGMVTALARIEGRADRDRRQQPDADGRRDHQRRLRQGGAVHAALRRLRHPAAVADRHAGHDGRPRRRGDGARPPLLAPLQHRRQPAGAAGRA